VCSFAREARTPLERPPGRRIAMAEEGIHPFIPNLRREREILKSMGVESVEDLLRVIPEGLRVKGDLGVFPPAPMKPWEVEFDFERKMRLNVRIPLNRVFAGGPVCPHYVHPVVQYILSRGEFLTSYTPYQPEINQGVLQALYEYQSLMAELLGVDVVNAGMYDGATSLAEALLMAIRVTGRREVALPESLDERYKSVVRTYLRGPEAKVHYYGVDRAGQPDLGDVERILSSREVAAVVAENPSSHGVINRAMAEIQQIASSRGALSVALVEPLLMGIFVPPGDMGYDVVVAEGQSLGLPMNAGGPLLGVFGIRYDQRLLRQMPGRLIGATVDAEGRRGFMMILQTREQHIRREKATSNITTNTALNAIGAAVHLSLLGERGMRWIASYILDITSYAAEKLRGAGFPPIYEGATHFKRLAYRAPPGVTPELLATEAGILPFTPLGNGMCLSCFTEVHSKSDVDELVRALGGEANEAL